MDTMSSFAVWIYFFSVAIVSDAQFLTEPLGGTKCLGSSYTLAWSYIVTPNDALLVVWRKEDSSILTWIPSTNGYTYGAGYSASKIEHNDNNGNITIKSLSASDAGIYTCRVTYTGSGLVVLSENATVVISSCLTMQTSTFLTTESTTSINTFAFINATSSMVTGDITSTRDISASTASYMDTEATNFYENTDTTIFNANNDTTRSYTNIETASFNANIETTNVNVNTDTTNLFANTATNEIQTETSRIVYNTLSAETDFSGSEFFDTTSQQRTDILASPGHSLSSEENIALQSAFETSYFLSKTISETSFFYSVYTKSANLFYTLGVSFETQVTPDSSKNSILFKTISSSDMVDYYTASFSPLSVPSLVTEPLGSALDLATPSPVNINSVNTVLNSMRSENVLMSSSAYNSNHQQTFSSIESPWVSSSLEIDQISYASNIQNQSSSTFQRLSETTVTFPNDSESRQLPLSMIGTNRHDIYTTQMLTNSYPDDATISYFDSTGVYQTFSQDYASSISTSFGKHFQTTGHHLSLQTNEVHIYTTMKTELTLYLTASFHESHTNIADTGRYAIEKVTSEKLDVYTSVVPSETPLVSMSDIQDSIIDFQSTYFESYSKSNHDLFSSEISEYVLSTMQSTSLLLPFITNSNDNGVDSHMKLTNMLTFESQSGIPTMDSSLFTNYFSTQIPAVSHDFKTTLKTTTIDFNSTTLLAMLKPSSKQIPSGISYIEIDTSFKDSLSSLDSLSDSLASNAEGIKSITTMSINTIQSGLSEKNKNIIFLTTSSVVITMIVVILLMVFAKVYMSKSHKENDDISSSNKSIPPKTVFADVPFTGKSVYPLLNTASTSFKMFHYEQHWNDIV